MHDTVSIILFFLAVLKSLLTDRSDIRYLASHFYFVSYIFFVLHDDLKRHCNTSPAMTMMKVFTCLCLLMIALVAAAEANTDLSIGHAKKPRLKEGKIDGRLDPALQLLRRIPRGGAWRHTVLPPATAAYLGAQGMLEITNPNMMCVTKILDDDDDDNNNNKEFPSISSASLTTITKHFNTNGSRSWITS
jgi:hypothetical protein